MFSVVARPLLALLCLLATCSLQAADLVVRRIIDGDTLLLSNGERVRLIGVDTPEVHPSAKLDRDAGGSRQRAAALRELGGEASRFVKGLVEGEPVRLEMDPVNGSRKHRDRYGRLLAYVYFEPGDCDALDLWIADAVCGIDSFEDGFLNALIVEAGYASVYTRAPFQYMDQFRRFEKEARQENRGLWGPAPFEVKEMEMQYAQR
jgi:micrococcal nuclease